MGGGYTPPPMMGGETAAPVTWPRLLPGTEPIGRAGGSGLRESPYLVRRCDGQVIQLSHLLFVIAGVMDGRSLQAIAAYAQTELELGIGPDQVAYVAEHKLAPLGLVAFADGRAPRIEPRNALLALRFRAAIVPERAVNAVAGLLRALFVLPIVIAALAGLGACDVWLAASHGIGGALGEVVDSPGLVLALFALTVLSLAFHECGHAAACRYGGPRPGRIGIGIYLVWPVFYTDVTDSCRLSKAGRLRTDLGGVYFNAWVALIGAGLYFATGYGPLLIVLVTQQLLILDQFVPWVRLDGYHIVSDLVGVPDLFARIRPVIASLRPGRAADRRVSELKPWVRAAVTFWVLTTIIVLVSMSTVVILNAPSYLDRAWHSLALGLDVIAGGVRGGSVLEVLDGAVSTVMLLLPGAGLTLTYLLLCRGIGVSLALRRARVDPQ